MHHLARLPFIDAGELVLTLGEPLATVHRYAMLHAAKAALVLHGIPAERHTAVRTMFRRHLVETGLVESEWADAIVLGSDERIQSDYDIDACSVRRTRAKHVNVPKRFSTASGRWSQVSPPIGLGRPISLRPWFPGPATMSLI